MKGKRSPDCDIDLGLAVSALSLAPGQTRTLDEIAAFCGCSHQLLSKIEQGALRKLRRMFSVYKHPGLRELHDHYLHPPDMRAEGATRMATTPDRPARPLYIYSEERTPKYQREERELCYETTTASR